MFKFLYLNCFQYYYTIKNYDNWDYPSLRKTIMVSFSHKQSPKSNPTERCSESTQQTRRNTPTLKYEFNLSRNANLLKSHFYTRAPSGIYAYLQNTLS